MKKELPGPYNFEDAYSANAPHVLRICMGYTNDDAQARDLLQEVFIKVWQHLPGFRGDAKLSTWIYRITINACLTHIRNEKNKPAIPLTENIDKADESAHAVKEEKIQALHRAIQQLAETDRLIISMVLEEIPYPEIAEALQLTEGNLRVKIHRIKQELSKIISGYGEF